MKKVAIYGKGGIGKSTICANISAALSQADRHVLQIGCDPKHDSTRLLLKGQKIQTVLDYLKNTNPMDYQLSDILGTGFGGVDCIEAGGPEPGVGCAGRGILSTFELLNALNLQKRAYDLMLYDVLGDVVCGGFAVPIREEYADEIYIVTSGEFMSLYAANNILRGIKNYDYGKKRVAGLIWNMRNVQGEKERVEGFAQAVELPVFAVIPRRDEFALGEKTGQTIVEGWSHSPLAGIFKELAKKIILGPPLYAAKPLTDEELEKIVLGLEQSPILKKPEQREDVAPSEIMEGAEVPSTDLDDDQYFSKSIVSQEPLRGCAFNGAVTMSVHVQDAIVVAHGPKSCTYITYQGVTSCGRRGLFERGSLLPVSIAPNLMSTKMDEKTMVFGGAQLLKGKVEEAKRDQPKAVILVSTCPSGIIGDDLTAMAALEEEDLPVIPIVTDGNIGGDYLQGMILAYLNIAKALIDREASPLPDTVNIISEKVVAKNTPDNFTAITDLLTPLGITVNCRYLCETTVDQIRNFMRAPLNILAHQDYTGRLLKRFFQKEYGAVFLDDPFPIGFYETKNWLAKVADFFHKTHLLPQVIADNEAVYRREIEALKKVLKGKKLMVVAYNHQLDWLLEVALDAGMEIVKVGILDFSQDAVFVTRFGGQFPLEEKYDPRAREKDIQELRPDLFLSNYAISDLEGKVVADTIPYTPDVGFFSGLCLAKRWAKLMQINLVEGWKKDEILFQKYHTR
ncbi:AAA family ATPase [Dehalobacterium formicoaceticum]|uniref:nitrogenase n=1 Tax=Dehalobacterium formicoaceticum TaxID=51515 RepID=A0ABT1Y5A4_9FIRM|nr:nitrogenase component 1 [Dehalobacterium formicoaceticum]MCR6546050.1 AAA family ATPase [Dehalobacterium formicoaceticum]